MEKRPVDPVQVVEAVDDDFEAKDLGDAFDIRHSVEAFDWNGLPTPVDDGDEGDEFECLAAFDGQKMVGSVIYQNTGDFLWLEHVYVLPAYRRRGMAEALVRQAMAENPGLPLEGNYRSDEMNALVRKLGGVAESEEDFDDKDLETLPEWEMDLVVAQEIAYRLHRAGFRLLPAPSTEVGDAFTLSKDVQFNLSRRYYTHALDRIVVAFWTVIPYNPDVGSYNGPWRELIQNAVGPENQVWLHTGDLVEIVIPVNENTQREMVERLIPLIQEAKPIDRKRLEKVYNKLFHQADRLIKHHCPCGVTKTGQCVSCVGEPQVNKMNHLCCGGCEHLGPEGCQAEKPMACRTWLCPTAMGKADPAVMNRLGDIAHRAAMAKLYAVRGDKPTTMRRAEMGWKDQRRREAEYGRKPVDKAGKQTGWYERVYQGERHAANYPADEKFWQQVERAIGPAPARRTPAYHEWLDRVVKWSQEEEDRAWRHPERHVRESEEDDFESKDMGPEFDPVKQWLVPPAGTSDDGWEVAERLRQGGWDVSMAEPTEELPFWDLRLNPHPTAQNFGEQDAIEEVLFLVQCSFSERMRVSLIINGSFDHDYVFRIEKADKLKLRESAEDDFDTKDLELGQLEVGSRVVVTAEWSTYLGKHGTIVRANPRSYHYEFTVRIEDAGRFSGNYVSFHGNELALAVDESSEDDFEMKDLETDAPGIYTVHYVLDRPGRPPREKMFRFFHCVSSEEARQQFEQIEWVETNAKRTITGITHEPNWHVESLDDDFEMKDLETDTPRPAMVVHAFVLSDDHEHREEFDAGPWLMKASLDELVDLARCNFRGPCADEVAQDLSREDSDLDDFFGAVTGGFEAIINPWDADHFLSVNRPREYEILKNNNLTEARLNEVVRRTIDEVPPGERWQLHPPKTWPAFVAEPVEGAPHGLDEFMEQVKDEDKTAFCANMGKLAEYLGPGRGKLEVPRQRNWALKIMPEGYAIYGSGFVGWSVCGKWETVAAEFLIENPTMTEEEKRRWDRFRSSL